MLNTRFLLLLGIAVAGQPAMAAVDPKGVWYVGGNASNSPSANAGVVHSLPGSSLGRGLAIRAGVGVGSYEYEVDGRKIDARYAALSTGLVYQTSGSWGWANISAGPSLTRTQLSPLDRDNRSRGTRLDATTQIDGSLQGQSYDVRWIGSVALRDQNYYGRLQPGLRVTRGIIAGVDLGVQGGRTYRQQSYGIFARKKVGKVDVAANLGYSQQPGVKDRPFAGIALSQVF